MEYRVHCIVILIMLMNFYQEEDYLIEVSFMLFRDLW